jgi:hypothetical protein
MDLSSLLFARVSFLFRESAQNAKRFSAGEEHFRERAFLSLFRARAPPAGFFFCCGKLCLLLLFSPERKMSEDAERGFKKEKK